GLLDALADAGVPTGAVTNQDSAYQWAKLAAVGLDGRFAVLVGIDVLGRGKPDPRVFLLGCERLGGAPAETADVGGARDVDARGARDAGLIGVWLDRHGARGSGTGPDDVPVVGGLDEVPALLGLRGVP